MASIYLKYGAVEGSSTEAAYNQWIQVSTLSFGAGRGINMGRGQSTDRASGDVSFSEVTLTMVQDNGTLGLYQAMLGTAAVAATIALVTDVKGKATQYMSLELTDTMVSGMSFSTGGERPSVSLSLSYIKIEVDIAPMAAAGTLGDAVKVIYDIGLGQLT